MKGRQLPRALSNTTAMHGIDWSPKAIGFIITGFYESGRENDPIAAYMPSYIATRAEKPSTDGRR